MNDLDDLDNKIFNISWEHITTCCELICREAEKLEEPAVSVIANQQDAVIAAMVADELNLPLGIAQLDESLKRGLSLQCIPKVMAPIRSGEYHQPKHTVLLVAAMIDNDTNIDDLVAYYKARGNIIVTMSAYSRKKVDNPPDFNAALLAQTVKYVFPWK